MLLLMFLLNHAAALRWLLSDDLFLSLLMSDVGV